MTSHHEYITNDPSTLSDQYLYQVRERLATGRAYPSDYKYAKEANSRFGGQTVSDVPKGRGVVYLRIDKTGGLKPYIGQAESSSRYLQRQKEHARANPDADFTFQIIVTGVPGDDLTRKEQQAIDAYGGVTNKKNPDGGTSNQRNPGKSLPKQNTDGGN